MLTYAKVKALASEVSGITLIFDDICVNGCHPYVSLFCNLETCYKCGAPCFDPAQLQLTDKRVPLQHDCTIPLGPQLQAIYCAEEGMCAMQYLNEKTQQVVEMLENLNPELESKDMASSLAQSISSLCSKLILPNMIFLLVVPQLYQDKKSDTWIVI